VAPSQWQLETEPSQLESYEWHLNTFADFGGVLVPTDCELDLHRVQAAMDKALEHGAWINVMPAR
jgi:hypothetical protein